MNIKPLIIAKARHAAISGGYYRLYEILKNGKSEGINYVIVTDSLSYRNYVQMFPDFKEILEEYKSYVINLPKIKLLTPHMPRGLKAITSYWDSFLLATSISKIAREENVDLIVGPSEGTQIVWTSYFSGRMCHIPWTALFSGTSQLLQPTAVLGPINPVNVLKHVSQKESTRKTPLTSKFGFSMELLGLLKITQESLILTVSSSMCEEMRFLNPRITFHVITPGNGVDLKKFDKKSRPTPLYDAVFFSRLVPEKGMFDLPEIWKLVVQKFPKARLAVAGIVEDLKFVEDLQRMISRYGLTKNIVFLGSQEKNSIIDLVGSSKLTIYPSTLDTFSLVVLESLACGTPTITYDIPAITHNFRKCKAVLSSPVKDKASMAKNVISLLENEDLRTKLSKEAKEYASDYDWKKVVRAEKEAYFKVIEWFNS
jgi:glycosyltransferase involved in cell wall biosynthesis